MVSKKARSLIRAGFFCAHQLEDLQQELLISVLGKVDKYRPKKNSLYGFVKKVVDRCACDLIRVQKMQYVDIELQQEEDYENSFSDLELYLDLKNLFEDSDDPDLLVIFELAQMMNVAKVSKITGKSMKTIYRKLAKIREIIGCR